MPRQPPGDQGVYLVWRGRGYWLREEDGEVLLYGQRRPSVPVYRLQGVGVTPTYDFGVFSIQTGKQIPGIFHRYMVQQKGPHRFPKIPKWFSPDHLRY